MVERHTGQNSGPRVDVTIRQTPKLTESNGRTPEKVVAKYVATAFDDIGYSYDISFGHDTFDAGSEQGVCGEKSAYDEWADAVFGRDINDLAKDSNILLTNATSGGCGAVGGPPATAAAGDINEEISVQEHGPSGVQGSIHGVLHEIAHNLGLGHDNRDDIPGYQYAGTGWNEPYTIFGFTIPWFGKWHQTPNFAGKTPTTNLCGEEIPERKYSNTVFHQRYTECAAERFEVADDTWYQNT